MEQCASACADSTLDVGTARAQCRAYPEPPAGPHADTVKVANALLASRTTLGRVTNGALAQRTCGECALAAAWLCADVVATGTPAAVQLVGAAAWPAVLDALRCAAVEVKALHTADGIDTASTGGAGTLSDTDNAVDVSEQASDVPQSQAIWPDLSESGICMVRLMSCVRMTRAP